MDKILQDFAGRLGLKDDSLIRKAEEFVRIYQSKTAIKNLSDAAKSILCLDLAATGFGVAFDQQQAIKLSGLKKQVYFNNLHTLEKILQVDKVITIRELCVQLGCTNVIKLAETILDQYKKKHQIRPDFMHPQYTAVAVYTACSARKIKVEKSKLYTASQLKPNRWKELTVNFMKFFESSGITELQDTNNKHCLCVKLVDISETANTSSPPKKKCIGDDEDIEPYEEWRKRILEESYQALKNR